MLRLAGSVLVSAGILWVLLREAGHSPQEVLKALTGIGLWVWVAYAVAQVVQGWLRAVRYRLLLAGAGASPLPGRGRMFGVTLARNMFVDMLPARAGELMYWALLNRGEQVKSADCVSSMTISVLFDFLALAVVLGCAVATPMLEGGGRVVLVWGAGVLVAGVAIGGWVLFRGPGWAAWVAGRLPRGTRGWGRLIGWLEGFFKQISDSFGQVKGSGVLWRAVGLSVGIRVVKYLGLAVAFYGVAQVLRPALAALPAWQVLIGLISGEGGAALPVPTFMSMGTYEAAGAGGMRLTGVSGTDAAVVLLGTHVASQIVDYTLGGLGLLGLLWGRRKADRTGAAAHGDANNGKANPILLTWVALMLVALVAGGGWMWRTQLKAGSKEAPGAGSVIGMGVHEMAALDEVWGDRSGFIVWSSTMYGQHDLVRFDWPSGQLTRLTKDPHVDSRPKISPDGTRVAFARSRLEWVSFRNLEEWDIWVLNLKTGRERRLAERGVSPCWTGDGKGVVFHRGGREVVQVDFETGAETVLLGQREHAIWTDPSVDPVDGRRVAVTVRGKSRSTSLISISDGAVTRVASGCQLAFAPSGQWMVLVEDGGQKKNQIWRVDRKGRNMEPLLDVPGPWSHEYFPRVSNDEGLLVFGSARAGHEHDTADYEIFLWRIGEPWDRAARVSFHDGNDHWPDVWVSTTP